MFSMGGCLCLLPRDKLPCTFWLSAVGSDGSVGSELPNMKSLTERGSFCCTLEAKLRVLTERSMPTTLSSLRGPSEGFVAGLAGLPVRYSYVVIPLKHRKQWKPTREKSKHHSGA